MVGVTSTVGRVRGGTLPVDLTSFLGRRRERAEIRRLLTAGRVVTLTGPGGVGKTRLAVRVAADVQRVFQGRVWFVGLAELREPELLGVTVAAALGLHVQSARAPIETISEYIGTEPALLVLDNCEHLVDECAQFITAVLHACGALRVLATSRQSLGLLGAHAFPVAALPVPEPEEVSSSPGSIAHYESVRLFAERATAVNPQFAITSDNCQTVARICHSLDGIPLALELAAVRMRALSLEQILQGLTERSRLLGSQGIRGTSDRQRTLTSLIDWSYDLCTEQERTVWARAAVFAGSFDLDAAEYVISGNGIDRDDMLDIVAALVDKSIFLRENHVGARFRLLQITREYGEQHLTEAGDLDRVRRRHRDWYARLAARFNTEWIGPYQAEWISRLRTEHPNLRVALDYCASQSSEAPAGLRMATALDDYWDIRGMHTELRHWLHRTLNTAPRDAAERVPGLRMCSFFAMLQGDAEQAQKLLAQAAELTTQAAIPTEKPHLTYLAGMASLFTGQLDTAAAQLTDALASFRAAGVLRDELATLFSLGWTFGLNNQRDRGLEVLQECLSMTKQLGDMYWRSWALWAVAHIEVDHGWLDHAEAAAREALDLQHRLENQQGMAFTTDALAWIAEQRGDHLQAAELFGTADRLWHDIGASPHAYTSVSERHTRCLDRTRRALGDTAFNTAFSRGVERSDSDTTTAASQAGSPPARQSRPETPLLTRREYEIAGLVRDGLSNKDIAAKLVISQRTAEAHVEHILTKLGFTSRTQIATWMTLQQGPAQ